MSLEDLSYEHEEQLKSFLKFFRSKRNYQIQEVEACFADQLDVMNEDMYTKDEIRRSMDSLCTAVRSSVLTDLQMTANMSMLVLRQLLEEAEASEIDMDLDMTIIEDQSLLAEASKVAIDAPTRKRRNQKNVKLGGIRDEHQRMMSEFEGVKKQNSELSDLVKDGKRKRKALRKEISSLRDQVDRLRFDNGNGNGNGNSNGVVVVVIVVAMEIVIVEVVEMVMVMETATMTVVVKSMKAKRLKIQMERYVRKVAVQDVPTAVVATAMAVRMVEMPVLLHTMI